MPVQFYTADVFTNNAFSGAQIAVVPCADEFQSEERMQKISAEFNLPATVFVKQLGENRFAVRLFAPEREIDFGSHATVAAAHVLGSTGKIHFTEKHTPIIFQHKNTNLQVYVTHDNNQPIMTQLSMSTKPFVDNYVPTQQEFAEILGIEERRIGIKNFDPLLVSNNGIYIVVPIAKFADLCAATFDKKAWDRTCAPSASAQYVLLFSSQTETPGSDFHLRLIGPQVGVNEDPPVGEAIPAFAAYLCSHKHIKKGTYSFIAERGLKQRRQSLLNIELDNKPGDELTLRVGGSAVLVCEGKMAI